MAIKRFRNKTSGFLSSVLTYLILAMFLANIFLPFMLLFTHSHMGFVVGNPKPVYFYDIGSSCDHHAESIKSSLDDLSSKTGVKFVRLPSPVALLIGGISYGCTGVFSNYGIAGEAESGMIGASYFIFVWNNVELSDKSKSTILHETLHVMGFDHIESSSSIMYPYTGNNDVEDDLTEFIRKMYVNNPIAYLNIIPLNLFYEAFFLFVIISLIVSKLFRKY